MRTTAPAPGTGADCSRRSEPELTGRGRRRSSPATASSSSTWRWSPPSSALDCARGEVPGFSRSSPRPARNGVEVGIRVSGLGDQWFVGPAALPGRRPKLFPGYAARRDEPRSRRLGDRGDASGWARLAIAASRDLGAVRGARRPHDRRQRSPPACGRSAAGESSGAGVEFGRTARRSTRCSASTPARSCATRLSAAGAHRDRAAMQLGHRADRRRHHAPAAGRRSRRPSRLWTLLTRADDVHRELRAALLSGTPCTAAARRHTAERFNTSRTPVREALRRSRATATWYATAPAACGRTRRACLPRASSTPSAPCSRTSRCAPPSRRSRRALRRVGRAARRARPVARLRLRRREPSTRRSRAPGQQRHRALPARHQRAHPRDPDPRLHDAGPDRDDDRGAPGDPRRACGRAGRDAGAALMRVHIERSAEVVERRVGELLARMFEEERHELSRHQRLRRRAGSAWPRRSSSPPEARPAYDVFGPPPAPLPALGGLPSTGSIAGPPRGRWTRVVTTLVGLIGARSARIADDEWTAFVARRRGGRAGRGAGARRGAARRPAARAAARRAGLRQGRDPRRGMPTRCGSDALPPGPGRRRRRRRPVARGRRRDPRQDEHARVRAR